MSLSVAVTKKSVTNTQQGLYLITLTLVLTDTSGEGFTEDYSQEYRTGENIATKVQMFINQMQPDIYRYKAAQALLNNAALATAITNIQNGLTL